MHSKKIIKSIGVITASTLFSRILGYARDMAIANYFGAHAIADAFYVAYRIPNLLRRLLGEGALIAAFVPVYTGYLTNKDEEDAKRFLSTLATFLSIALIAITIAGIYFAPLILKVIAPGFAVSSEKFTLAVTLTRIMFPFFIAVGISALFMGILNSHHVFLYPAISPCFLSLSELAFMFLICPFMENPITGLAMGVVCGGMLQALFQLPVILRRKIRFSISFNWRNEGFRRVALLMLPAAMAVSVDQLSAFIDVICASWLKVGSISALYYSNHLTLFPMGLFGVAVSTVSLPALSRAASYNNFDEIKSTLNTSLRFMIYCMMPSLVGLAVLAYPVVRLLFERGKFNNIATVMTSQALVFYTLGLTAYASVKILSTAFYSLKDTKTPVKTGSISMIMNAELNLILMQYMQVRGLAFATAIASTFNALMLFYFLRKKIGRLGLKKMTIDTIKIIISAGIMGIICRYLYIMLFDSRILSVFVPIFAGIVVYFLLTYLLRIDETIHILDIIKGLKKKNVKD
ncbi:murein biosynthesis integral membrane protein MurJ [bacterium]